MYKIDSVQLQYPTNNHATLISKAEYVDPADPEEGLKLFKEIIESIKEDENDKDGRSSLLFQTMPWLGQNNREEYKKMLSILDEFDESM